MTIPVNLVPNPSKTQHRLREHAANSYGFICKILVFIDLCLLSIPFASDVFVVIKNHHLQLEVLAFKAQFSILDLKNENSTNFGSSLTVLVLYFINFVIYYLSLFVTKVWK